MKLKHIDTFKKSYAPNTLKISSAISLFVTTTLRWNKNFLKNLRDHTKMFLGVKPVYIKNFFQLSHLYFIFGTLTGSIGLLISLFLRLAVSPKIYVDTELIHTFYLAHASCTVFFFSLCVSGLAYNTLAFVFTKSKYNNLFLKTGKLSLMFAIFSFLILFLILVFDLEYFNHNWFMKIPFSNWLLEKSELQIISSICFVVSHLLLSLNITNVITTSKIKVTSLPIFVFTLLLASILIVAVLPTFASVIIMSFYTNIGTLFSESICDDKSLLIKNFLWVITYISFFQILLISMGIISHIVLKMSRNNKFYKQNIVLNLTFLGVVGHFYWFINLIDLCFYFEIEIVILALRIITVFVISTLLICWCFCLYKSEIRCETAVLFAAGYIFTMFLGLSFLFFLSLTSFETLAYFENVLLFYYFYVYVIAFAFFVGFYLCFYEIFNYYYSEFLGVLHFWAFFIGSILNFLPQFLIKMEMYQNISIKTNWVEFVSSLGTISELGFSFLIASFFLFFIIVIEALEKKRTKKQLVNLNKFDIKKATNGLDFLIALCYFVFFLLFFILTILNQIYWILIMYSVLFLALVAASMSPKVTHYFNPVKEKSYELHYSYKESWPFLYYFIQFVKIFFTGLNLYIIFFSDIVVNDFYENPDFLYHKPEIDSYIANSFVMMLYKILSPIFFFFIIFEMFVKLYELNSIFLRDTSHKSLNAGIVSQISKRGFSSIAGGGLLKMSKTAAMAPAVIKPGFVIVVLAGGIVITSVSFLRFIYIDIPNNLLPYETINQSRIQNFHHWWNYGYTFPTSRIFYRHSILETALGHAVLKTEVIRLLELNRTETLTLAMLDEIVRNPKYYNQLCLLRMDEQHIINFSSLYYGYYQPVLNGVITVAKVPVQPILKIKSWVVRKFGTTDVVQPVPESQPPFVVVTKEVFFSRSLTRIEKLCDNSETFYNGDIY